MFSALVVVAFASTAGASACACEQEVSALQRKSASLEAELASLRRTALSREDVQALVREHVARELKNGGFDGDTLRTARVDGDGTTHSHRVARRLSSGTATHVSVESRHIHEFPTGHTCGTIAGYMAYLPLKSDGSVSWEPSPSNVTDQYSIGTVANDWSQTRLQALDAPLKIVHDAACASAPTLELQLPTQTVGALSVGGALTVTGALTVAGVDLAARVALLQQRSVVSFPNNCVLQSGSDARSVVITGGLLGGNYVTPTVLVSAIVNPGGTAALQTWFLVNKNPTTIRAVAIDVSVSGGNLLMTVTDAKYKDPVANQQVAAATFPTMWTDGSMSSTALAHSGTADGYGALSVEYIIV